MPRKATTPKPITFALTSDKTGVTLKVGNSPTTAATLYPRHVTELARLLGVTLSADGKSVAQWIEAVKTAEAERDGAKKQEAVWKENYHLAAQERIDLRTEKGELVSKTFQLSEELNAERRLVENLREGNVQLGKERDQARADHAAADVALQDTLKKLDIANRGWNRAGDRADQWEKAARKNLDDFNATKRDLTTLQANFDALLAEQKTLVKARLNDAAAHAAELTRAKALGWLYFGALFVCGALGFISLVVKGGR
jgi:chromosome segregation ATPase